jgi:hypothetical protein
MGTAVSKHVVVESSTRPPMLLHDLLPYLANFDKTRVASRDHRKYSEVL